MGPQQLAEGRMGMSELCLQHTCDVVGGADLIFKEVKESNSYGLMGRFYSGGS